MSQSKLRDRGVYTLPAWTPFGPAVGIPHTEMQIQSIAEKSGVTIETVREMIARIEREERIVKNSRYQVSVREIADPEGKGPPMHHLSIKRLDRRPLGPERFRDFQRIKNELAGPEREAVEVYPAESRLVDTSNQYHLWVLPEGARLPFGFDDRTVTADPGGNARQQPFEKE